MVASSGGGGDSGDSRGSQEMLLCSLGAEQKDKKTPDLLCEKGHPTRSILTHCFERIARKKPSLRCEQKHSWEGY